MGYGKNWWKMEIHKYREDKYPHKGIWVHVCMSVCRQPELRVIKIECDWSPSEGFRLCFVAYFELQWPLSFMKVNIIKLLEKKS